MTDDGGVNWSDDTDFNVTFLRRFVAVNANHFWLLSKTGHTYPTYFSPDSGLSWNLTPYNFTAIDFIDDFTGYAIQEGALYCTSNGGETWIMVNENPDIFKWVSNLKFPAASFGLVWDWFRVYCT